MDKNKWLYKIFGPLDRYISGKKEGTMLNTGEQAPNFIVQNHYGKTVSLTDFKGKKVVLWFYPKADTPGCTAEACAFRDRIGKFAEKNAVLLGVSFDTVEENAAFAKKFHVDYPLLCDTKRDLGVKYGACKSPTDSHASRIAYVIDEQGNIAAAYPKVDAANFPETVLNTL